MCFLFYNLLTWPSPLSFRLLPRNSIKFSLFLGMKKGPTVRSTSETRTARHWTVEKLVQVSLLYCC